MSFIKLLKEHLGWFFSVGLYQSLGQDRYKHGYDTAGEMGVKEGRIGVINSLLL